VHKVLENYINATNTHNFINISKILSSYAVFYFTNASCSGKDIKEYFENSWKNIQNEEYWASDVQCLHEDDTTLVFLYQYNYRGYINGELTQGNGRATNVFIKNDNKWELLHEHLSRRV